MREQELRALVREAIARHLGDATGTPAAGLDSGGTSIDAPSVSRDHASHAVYINIVNPDNACVIEPDVTCNHCNYCRSHGH
jgi:hypothetical protein